MGLFIFFLTRLMKEKRSVQLVNIRDEKLKDGTLSLPATTSYFQLSLLMVAFILVAVITTAINLFTNLHLSPFGHSPLDVLVLFLILAGVSVLFARNIFIDSLISQFNSTATASKLRLNYWIIPGKLTGLPTADHLTKQAIEIHSLTYIFYLVAVALFSLPELLAQLLHIPITHLPFGPLGFIIILTLSSQLGYALVDTVQRYIQRINSGNLWALPHVTFSNLNLFLEPYDVAEFVLKLLPNATPEERVAFAQVLSSLTTGKTVLSDIQTAQRILREIAKRQAEEPLEMSFGQFLRRLLPCVILSLAFTVVVTWVIQLFYPQALTDLAVKEGLVFFFFGTFIALIPVVGLDQFVKSLFKRLHSGSPQRAVAAPELGTGQELDTFQSRLWYNEIVASQREVIDVERRNILAQSDIHQRVLTMLREEVHSLCEDSIPHDRTMTEEELETLLEKLDSWAPVPESLVPEDLAILTYDELEQKLTTFVLDSYEERHEAVKRLAKTWGKDEDPFLELERRYALQTLDRLWAKYLDELNSMYSNMRFRSLTQGDLVTEFRRDAQAMFEELQEAFRHTLTNTLLRSFHYSITGFPRPKSPRTLPSSEEYRALPQTVGGEDEHETDSQQNHSVPPE
jgi:SecA-like APTase subunit of protein translocation complex